MSDGENLSDEDRDFGRIYLSGIQAAFERAGKGIPINAPKEAIAYSQSFLCILEKCLTHELEKCFKTRAPSYQKRFLLREAKRFREPKGWRSEIPSLAEACEKALRARAMDTERGRAGDPGKQFGKTKILEREYANRAFDELSDFALAQGRMDWVNELFASGSKNSPSRGRSLVARYAIKLAMGDGKCLNRKSLSIQIRERAKSHKPITNFLASYVQKKSRVAG